MKKLFIIGVLLMLTGCFNNNLNANYEEMNIGTNLDSYELDLRIYGTINNNKESVVYKIDNYKNEEYTIFTEENTYYIANNKTYKSSEPGLSLDTKNFSLTDEKIYYNTDIILQGLKNIDEKNEVKNNITVKEYKVYAFTIEDSYVKDLLTALGYDTSYNKAFGKVYLSGKKVYRIIYSIDSLTINGTFSKINTIRKNNLKLEE